MEKLYKHKPPTAPLESPFLNQPSTQKNSISMSDVAYLDGSSAPNKSPSGMGKGGSASSPFHFLKVLRWRSNTVKGRNASLGIYYVKKNNQLNNKKK